jgi:hypothetical protein
MPTLSASTIVAPSSFIMTSTFPSSSGDHEEGAGCFLSSKPRRCSDRTASTICSSCCSLSSLEEDVVLTNNKKQQQPHPQDLAVPSACDSLTFYNLITRANPSSLHGMSSSSEAEGISSTSNNSKASSTASPNTATIQELLANLTDISIDDFDDEEEESGSSVYEDEEDEDDDSSVLSDISDVTGNNHFNSESRLSRASIDRPPPRYIIPSTKKTTSTKTRGRSTTAAAPTSSVSFGAVNIRYYERILTDNPSCADGRAIGLGWNVEEVREYTTVDAWQDARRSHGKKLQLSKKKRERILAMQGYSEREIEQMAHVIHKIRHQRQATFASLGSQEVEELVESARHTVKKFLFLKKKKDNMKTLLYL